MVSLQVEIDIRISKVKDSYLSSQTDLLLIQIDLTIYRLQLETRI
jgi:hypothetical protein